jgi:hypothetical protein
MTGARPLESLVKNSLNIRPALIGQAGEKAPCTFSQLVTKPLVFYETSNFITVFTTAVHHRLNSCSSLSSQQQFIAVFTTPVQRRLNNSSSSPSSQQQFITVFTTAVQHRLQNNPSLIPIPSQMNPVHFMPAALRCNLPLSYHL